MTAETLFLAIGTADEEFLEQSEQTGKRRTVSWRAWAAAAACLCLIVAGGRALWKPPENAGGESSAQGIACGCADEFRGGIWPVLQVNGRLYQWHDLNGSGGYHLDEDGVVRGYTYLPEGFREAGEISSVTEELPVEDFQIQAGTPISGTVYVDPEAPLVVYACVTTDWLENCYVRFVSEDYKTGKIRVAGKLYSWYIDDWKYYDRLKELPQGAVYVGTIQTVVEDRYPIHDLEANNDNFFQRMTGREIFQDPADDSVIYVQDEQHWSGGISYFWRACPLWEGD